MLRCKSSTVLLALFFAAQIAFAYGARKIEPFWSVLPPVPSGQVLRAEAFGDDEFLYRLLVMDLQNFGDTGGHWTALKDYDMTQVVQWLRALDTLDLQAEHHIMLAARYFSQTQNHADLPPLVAYIREHVARSPAAKLQWLSEALYIAEVRLKDRPLALQIADQLASYDFPTMSLLAYELPAMIHEKYGDLRGAASLMAQTRFRLQGRIAASDLAWMDDYVARTSALASQK